MSDGGNPTKANAGAEGSRFRPQYRQLSDAEKATIAAFKAKAAELEAMLESAMPPGRYRALALTDLESAIHWATKGVTG